MFIVFWEPLWDRDYWWQSYFFILYFGKQIGSLGPRPVFNKLFPFGLGHIEILSSWFCWNTDILDFRFSQDFQLFLLLRVDWDPERPPIYQIFDPTPYLDIRIVFGYLVTECFDSTLQFNVYFEITIFHALAKKTEIHIPMAVPWVCLKNFLF